MPTRDVVLRDRQALLRKQHEAERSSRLAILRTAIRLGVMDIEAGRYAAFDADETLDAHLSSIALKACAKR